MSIELRRATESVTEAGWKGGACILTSAVIKSISFVPIKAGTPIAPFCVLAGCVIVTYTWAGNTFVDVCMFKEYEIITIKGKFLEF